MPWHRRFLSLYENALREECGYEGATPYVTTIALKAIINIFIFLQILGLDAGYRQFVSPFTQFVDRGRLISFLVFTTRLSSIRSLASVEMASLAHIPFRRIRSARPSFMTLNPLLDVWQLVLFTLTTPFAWKNSYQSLSRLRDEYHIYAILHSVCCGHLHAAWPASNHKTYYELEWGPK